MQVNFELLNSDIKKNTRPISQSDREPMERITMYISDLEIKKRKSYQLTAIEQFIKEEMCEKNIFGTIENLHLYLSTDMKAGVWVVVVYGIVPTLPIEFSLDIDI